MSAGDWNYYGTLVNGAAHFVPKFGPEGLLFVLGGSTSMYGISPDPIAYSQFSPLSFDDIYMFEPQSRRWSLQQTTGDRPWPVINPCVTGLEGDNGTYEVRTHTFLASTEAANTTLKRSSFSAVSIRRTLTTQLQWVLYMSFRFHPFIG